MCECSPTVEAPEHVVILNLAMEAAGVSGDE